MIKLIYFLENILSIEIIFASLFTYYINTYCSLVLKLQLYGCLKEKKRKCLIFEYLGNYSPIARIDFESLEELTEYIVPSLFPH